MQLGPNWSCTRHSTGKTDNIKQAILAENERVKSNNSIYVLETSGLSAEDCMMAHTVTSVLGRLRQETSPELDAS
jgi:hypothetical protein